DDEDPAGALDNRRIRGHQPDRAGPVNCHGLAGTHTGQFGSVISRWEDIGQQREIAFMLLAGRKRNTVIVGERHAKILRLTAHVRAHAHVAIGSAGARRVDRQTERALTRTAVFTESARHVERHRHSIAFVDGCHARADFFDDAHVFVPERDPRLGVGSALIHVQVRAANSRRGDPDDHIARIGQPRIFDVFNGHLVRALIYNSLHSYLSFSASAPQRFSSASKAATPAWATASSLSTVLPLTPTAPTIFPSRSLSGIPPGNVISP